MGSSRQLAAIMFTDIVGYTALMGSDEQKAFAILTKNRALQKPIIEEYGGRWIKELGDGVMASFNTVSDAVNAAIKIQEACNTANDFQLRIGIDQGEVVFENEDVFGDTVNIAARIQAAAKPGCICISESVHHNMSNKKDIQTKFIREELLKNVKEPVKIYEVVEINSNKTSPAYSYQNKIQRKGKHLNEKRLFLFILGLILLLVAGSFFYFKNKDKNKTAVAAKSESTDKSIAVLPFKNMSNDPSQDYFADAMMDEILNHLFKIGGWRIISYTSAMSYKGSKKTVKEIANELGVANVLQGSIQKEGNRIRIRVQLIDGKTDEHLWVETYEKEFKEVFAIQSDIAQKVASELKINIDPDVKQRIEALPTQNMEAYTLYLQARNIPEKSKQIALEKAIDLDSNFADAYTELAYYWLLQGTWHGDLRSEQVLQKAMPLLQKAMQINPDLASAHYRMADLQLWYRWDFEAVEKEYEKVLQLYPSNTEVASQFHDYLLAIGRFDEVLKLNINNFNTDKNNWGNWARLAFAYQYNNQPGKALQTIESAESLFPYIIFLKLYVIRINIYNNRFEQAIQAFNRIDSMEKIKLHPHNLGHLAIAYYKTGQINKGDIFLKDLKRKSQQSTVGSPYFHLAAVYTALGKNDLAIQSIEKSFTDHEVEMYQLKELPLFKSLHNDKRFQDIVNRIGYPK